LEVEEISVLIRLKPQYKSVVLSCYFLKGSIERKDDDINFFNIRIKVDPTKMIFVLLILDIICSTVKRLRFPLSLLTLTFLVARS